MKSKTKRVLWGFFSLDYKAMETYLEQMAKKGWMLEKVGRYIAKFRAIEPQELKFYVDVFTEGGPFTPEKTKEAEEYRSLCQESGWTFITSQDYLQFFYADAHKNPIPIQTDEEIEQKIVESTLWRNELLGMIIFSIIAVWVLSRYFPIKHNNLLSFTGIIGTLLFPILCISVIASAVYSLFWMLKARRSIKRGLPIQKPTLKNARRRMMAFQGTALCIGAIFIIAFICDAFFRPHIVGISLLGPIIGISIGSVLRYIIKKKSTKKENSVLYVVLALIFVLIFTPLVGSLFIDRFDDIDHTMDSIPVGYPVVSMEEMLEESQHGKLVSREFNYSMSPITPKQYNYWETMDINGNTVSIHTKYYQTIDSYFAEIIFNGVTEQLEKGFKWNGMYIFTKTIIIDDEMKNLWNVDNLAYTEERDELIVQKGSTVVHISGDINFENIQIRELIISKFFR